MWSPEALFVPRGHGPLAASCRFLSAHQPLLCDHGGLSSFFSPERLAWLVSGSVERVSLIRSVRMAPRRFFAVSYTHLRAHETLR